MIEFGMTLKKAREAKGLTIQQLAETTRMMSAIIEDLEREDFSRIVAPIYGRGFIKLYCEAVGLDPKPLIDEFMEIYLGHREPMIRTRESNREFISAPAPTPTPVSQPAPPPATNAHLPQHLPIRLILLCIAALLALAILIIGLRALYRATTTTTTTADASLPEESVVTEEQIAVVNPNRIPIEIQPLYID